MGLHADTLTATLVLNQSVRCVRLASVALFTCSTNPLRRGSLTYANRLTNLRRRHANFISSKRQVRATFSRFAYVELRALEFLE